MMPEQLRLLIAAYASGDLSPRRQRATRRLLKHSSEGRELLVQLRSDARRLRDLPTQRLPAEFSVGLVRKLPHRTRVEVTVPRADATRVRLTRVISACAAASFGLAVGLSWYFSLPAEPAESAPEVALRLAKKLKSAERVRSGRGMASDDVFRRPADRPAETVAAAATEPEVKPPLPGSAPAAAADVLTAPARPDLRTTEVVAGRLSLPLGVRSLAASDTFDRLAEELARAEAHRIELFCREPWQVVERLTPGCNTQKVKLIADPAAQEGQKRRFRQQYLLFSDALTAREWALLFRQLGSADRLAEEKRPGDGIFEYLVIAPPTAADQRELVSHLGVDLLGAANGPAPAVGARTPISGGTADKVVEALAKGDASAKGKPSARQAVLVPYYRLRALPFTSKEVRQYLDGRQAPRPGQVAVMLVISPPPG
jgi:hypothetical protein